MSAWDALAGGIVLDPCWIPIVAISRITAYALARDGEFPCPVLRVGVEYRVPTAGLLHVLGPDPSIG